MDKRFLAGVLTGIIIPALIFVIIPIAEGIYSIPPTPAWRTIEIENNANLTNSSQISITAINWRDTLRFQTDGSILLNITESP